MKKYYYDCPIQALYMNKEFGVDVYLKLEIIAKANLTTGESEKTTNEYHYEPLLDFINDEWGFEEVCKIVNAGVKIIVGDESNHIFEPKAGDICYSRYFDDFVKIINGSFDMQVNEIIMRDGKHFFMPKVIEE